MTLLVIFLLVLVFGYVAGEAKWDASLPLVQVAKLYALPAIAGLMLVALLVLDSFSSLLGVMLAQMLVSMLCVAYAVMVCLTASIYAVAKEVSPNQNVAVFVTIILLFVVLLSGALWLQHL